jgi:hypothetical protein
VIGSHLRSRRLGAILATAVFTLTLVPGVVTAAETRVVYVGDPAQVNANPLPNPFEIHPTAVSAGNTSYFDVLIKNKGKQTLTGATIGMGTLIAKLSDGSAGPALPGDWKIEDITPVPGISGNTPTCSTDPVSSAPNTGLVTPGGDYIGFSCNFGNLARNGQGAIRVYLKAGSSLSSPDLIQVSGKVAENVGGNVGSNSNTFFAVGTGTFYFTGDGVIAGLFSPSSKHPDNHLAGAPKTEVDFTLLTGDYVLSIQEVTPEADVLPCPDGHTCLGGASIVHLNFGNAVSPYFVWTMQFPVDSSYKLSKNTAFVHFNDDGVTFQTYYNVSQNSCFKPRATRPCVDFTLVPDGLGGTFVQVRFETRTNGSGKLF